MSKSNRRDFFKTAALGLLAIPAFRSVEAFAKACAPAKDAKIKAKLLDPKGKVSKRLAFVTDATKSTHKKYKAGSTCGDCKFYKAHKTEATYGKCAMAANKYVASCGWCKSYKVKKKKS